MNQLDQQKKQYAEMMCAEAQQAVIRVVETLKNEHGSSNVLHKQGNMQTKRWGQAMNEQDKQAFETAFKENNWWDNPDSEEIWQKALEYARGKHVEQKSQGD